MVSYTGVWASSKLYPLERTIKNVKRMYYFDRLTGSL